MPDKTNGAEELERLMDAPRSRVANSNEVYVLFSTDPTKPDVIRAEEFYVGLVGEHVTKIGVASVAPGDPESPTESDCTYLVGCDAERVWSVIIPANGVCSKATSLAAELNSEKR
jgi:hypothetical protein